MAWQTPKTNFTAADYYNYTDLNRVENNINELATLINTYSIISALTSITNRTNTSIEFYDSLNRIENNIQALADATFEPPGWIDVKNTWRSVLDSFSYADANRLESNLLALKTMIDSIISGLLFCGDSLTSICGKGNTLF